MTPNPCAICHTVTTNGCTVIVACDRHWDTPERSIDVLIECADALSGLLDVLHQPPLQRAAAELRAHTAIGRLRMDRFASPEVISE